MYRRDPEMTACYKATPTGVVDGPEPRTPNRRPGATIVRSILTIPPAPLVSRPALFDMTGREVMSLQPGTNDVRDLAPGVYFVREATNTRKIIVPR